jgi:hypothetical protein
MKKLLFGAAITMIVVSPALGGGLGIDQGDGCKGCPSWRSPASSDPPPYWLPQSPGPACHLVKERVGTRRNGHAVYQTHQICA